MENTRTTAAQSGGSRGHTSTETGQGLHFIKGVCKEEETRQKEETLHSHPPPMRLLHSYQLHKQYAPVFLTSLTSCRNFSSRLGGGVSPVAPPPPPSGPPPPAWVKAFNRSFSQQPAVTLGSYAVLDALSIAGIFTLYSYMGVSVSADLAVAFGLSRLLRKVRMPVDLAAGALLAQVVPSLAQVQVFPVAAPAAGKPPPSGTMAKAIASMQVLVNKYGLAYMVASRCCVGPLSVATIYACLLAGVDVQGALAALDSMSPVGPLSGAGNTAGVWAAAALTSAPLMPLTMGAAVTIGRIAQERKG